jgi:hypothetical protein
LKAWVAEALEQAAIASLLGGSVSPVMRRLSLIIVDNAFELLLKSFVEFDSQILRGKLKYSEWERDYRGNFDKVTTLVLAERADAFDKGTIMRYHNTRNSLYHSAQPLTVDPQVCGGYIGDLLGTISKLYGTSVDDSQWQLLLQSARKSLSPEKGEKSRQLVEVDLAENCSDPLAICCVVQAFHRRYGRSPELSEIDDSLSLSGHAMVRSRISIRLSELRSRGMIARKTNVLTPKGRGFAREALRPSTSS